MTEMTTQASTPMHCIIDNSRKGVSLSKALVMSKSTQTVIIQIILLLVSYSATVSKICPKKSYVRDRKKLLDYYVFGTGITVI